MEPKCQGEGGGLLCSSPGPAALALCPPPPPATSAPPGRGWFGSPQNGTRLLPAPPVPAPALFLAKPPFPLPRAPQEGNQPPAGSDVQGEEKQPEIIAEGGGGEFTVPNSWNRVKKTPNPDPKLLKGA